jgi:methyl-accepting chemotaxis protein
MTHEEMETAIARLFEGQDLLTGKVIGLAEEIAELNSAVKITREEVKIMREQAEEDRRVQREAIGEMREAVSRMIEIAESMQSNVALLTQMQKGTRQRREKLEQRVDGIERGIKRIKNRPKR